MVSFWLQIVDITFNFYRVNNKPDTIEPNATGQPLLETTIANGYVNEGSCESDQKSYAYCHIDPESNSSVDLTGNKRQTYHLFDRNRAKSSIVVDNEMSNPYNHVTVNKEITEYNITSFIKSKLEERDPSYSHMANVNTTETSKHDGQLDPSDKLIARPKTSQELHKRDKKKQKTLKVKTSHDEPCQTIENEETSFIKNNYSEKCRLDIAVTERAEKHNADEHTTGPDQDRKLTRSKLEYSIVQKNPKINDIVDHPNKENAIILFDHDDSSYTTVSSYDESECSSNNEDTPLQELQESESCMSWKSDDTLSERESGTGNLPPATGPVAVNAMYDDFQLPQEIVCSNDKPPTEVDN